jgi:iron complex outermembrane receptor protein
MRKHMLNKTLIFFTMFCCTLLGGTISGVILNDSDEPLPGANILIQGTSIGATTGINGEFQIRQLDVGKYDLRVDYIGYYEESIEFYISKFETDPEELDKQGNIEKLGIDAAESKDKIMKGTNISNVIIKLMPKLLDYDEVIVSASKSQEKVFDAPITVALVSQRKIKEFSGNDIGHALSKVKGIDVYQAGNGRTNINTRGFMSVFNGRFVTLLNGKKFSDPIFRTAYNNTYPTIMEDIERLEVVFGPSSALYGPNAHNGLLNIIPKHPNEKPGLDISYTSGSSNFQSQRLRYARSGNLFSYKINLENSEYKEWDYDRIYAPQDHDNDGSSRLQGEAFVDENNNGMIDSELYYDADHNGIYNGGGRTGFDA